MFRQLRSAARPGGYPSLAHRRTRRTVKSLLSAILAHSWHKASSFSTSWFRMDFRYSGCGWNSSTSPLPSFRPAATQDSSHVNTSVLCPAPLALFWLAQHGPRRHACLAPACQGPGAYSTPLPRPPLPDLGTSARLSKSARPNTTSAPAAPAIAVARAGDLQPGSA